MRFCLRRKSFRMGAKKSEAFLSLDLVFYWDETCCASGKKADASPRYRRLIFPVFKAYSTTWLPESISPPHSSMFASFAFNITQICTIDIVINSVMQD
ncbi:hypothetical protein QL285_090664 [Trifolium repens]|nr:hypothetical protein QL285_090664 [Trifolium repens]